MPLCPRLISAEPGKSDLWQRFSKEATALRGMGFQRPFEHWASELWVALLAGHDVAVVAPNWVHGEAAIPAALVRLAFHPSIRLLVLVAGHMEAKALTARVIPWAVSAGLEVVLLGNEDLKEHWPGAARCVVVGLGGPCSLGTNGIGSKEAKLRLPTGKHLLVVLAKVDVVVCAEGEPLREMLQCLPRPEQVIMMTESWELPMQQLAGEVLSQPLSIQIQPRQECTGAEATLSALQHSSVATFAPLASCSNAAGDGTGKGANQQLVVQQTVHQCSHPLKWDPLQRRWMFHVHQQHGQKVPFQITAKRAGGSREMAEHVARLCLQKSLEMNVSKNELLEYRDQLCQQCNSDSVGSKDVVAPTALSKSAQGCMQPSLTDSSAIRDAEDMRLMAGYVSNILCRSKNEDLRHRVMALLPPVSVKRKTPGADAAETESASASQQAEAEYWDGDISSVERKAIRDGVAALFVAHHQRVMQRAPGVRRPPLRSAQPVELQRHSSARSDADDDCSAVSCGSPDVELHF